MIDGNKFPESTMFFREVREGPGVIAVVPGAKGFLHSGYNSDSDFYRGDVYLSSDNGQCYDQLHFYRTDGGYAYEGNVIFLREDGASDTGQTELRGEWQIAPGKGAFVILARTTYMLVSAPPCAEYTLNRLSPEFLTKFDEANLAR